MTSKICCIEIGNSDLLWVAQVDLLADKNGGFVRMLGFELGVAEGTGPQCQRFAGIIEDGILLKVVSVAIQKRCAELWVMCLRARTDG